MTSLRVLLFVVLVVAMLHLSEATHHFHRDPTMKREHRHRPHPCPKDISPGICRMKLETLKMVSQNLWVEEVEHVGAGEMTAKDAKHLLYTVSQDAIGHFERKDYDQCIGKLEQYIEEVGELKDRIPLAAAASHLAYSAKDCVEELSACESEEGEDEAGKQKA